MRTLLTDDEVNLRAELDSQVLVAQEIDQVDLLDNPNLRNTLFETRASDVAGDSSHQTCGCGT
jgi:hypothetical protein